jgi:heme/copper-type cytochrome/quinol oxidase subunit 2
MFYHMLAEQPINQEEQVPPSTEHQMWQTYHPSSLHFYLLLVLLVLVLVLVLVVLVVILLSSQEQEHQHQQEV